MLGPARAWARYAQARRRSENDRRPGVERAGAVATVALAETWTSLARVGLDLEPQEWGRPTACPGWSVQDQFSHLIGIERMLLGEAAPSWDQPLGAHVRNEFAAAHEPWVAVRRALDGPTVRAEFVAVTTRRLAALAARTAEEWAVVGYSPAGDVPYAEFMRLRVFDWLGARAGRAHGVGAARWERRAGLVHGAGPGAVGHGIRRGQEGGRSRGERGHLRRDRALRATSAASPCPIEDGRATIVAEAAAPTVTVTLWALDFRRLGCGRTTPVAVAAADGVGVAGDPALARAIVDSMNFMF